ncbi:hypothetical protein FRC15_010850 [Serendipita sp. 397]|nr:hypothetical protein FRC15_010850 [Serendipita sp. 397]
MLSAARWCAHRFKPTFSDTLPTVGRLRPLAYPLVQPIRNVTSLAIPKKARNPFFVPIDMNSESLGNFDLLKRVDVGYTPVTVSKWRSRVTGLSVVHIDYEAPIVKGYFAVATEIFDDSGRPHTLEHLVFMGSEKYPYKGVLDNLANRAFSAGTNAWTDTDNTVYTIATAGQQGFLQLLPVYVDHILYPTMTQSAFVTEVHHIDGKGEDSGVVYSEMQGRQNTSGDLMALRAQRTAYPKSSAYRSETGGLMEALRVLDVDSIRDYHKSYYVPQNICLIVAGRVSTHDLLKVLQDEVEPTIIAHGQANGPRPEGWKRPFLETPSSIPPMVRGLKNEIVEFPEKDESVGELSMHFVGPSPHDQLTLKAIDVLGIYLTDTAAAPLTKEFVEIASPYCTYIGFYENARSTFTELAVYFGSVPVEHLDTLDEKFTKSLQRIASESIDMERMATVIARDRLKLRSALENSGGDVFSNVIINDFLYGDTEGKDLVQELTEHYETLQSWTSKQWTDLLLKYYTGDARIVIRGKPSADLADRLKDEEKVRLEAQVKELGPDGLAKLEKVLEEAKADHDKPIPEEVLTSFPVPDVKSISWISVQSAQNNPQVSSQVVKDTQLALRSSGLEEHLRKDSTRLPMTVQFDHVTSDFTTIHALMSLAELPDELRPYAMLYQMTLFNLPMVKKDGTRLNHEEVINALNKDTVAYDSGLGIDSKFSELLRMSIKVESTKYDLAVSWLRDVLFQSEFTKERLEVTLAKVQQSLPELKRDGNTVSKSVFNELMFDKSLTSISGGLLALMDWVPRVAAEVKEKPEFVIEQLKKVREITTKPSAFRFSVTGNILDLPTPKASLVKNFESISPVEPQALRWCSEALTDLGKKPQKKAVVVSLPTIESSFALHCSQAFTGFDHPDYPPLCMALEVLDGTESFLWKYIRGSGLAYGANMALSMESGLVSFSLYRSPNSYKAFQEAAKVVKGLCDGSIELKQTSIDAAQSSLVYALARRVSSPGKAALTSFVNQALKEVSQTWEQDVLAKLKVVTPSQVIDAMRRYVLPIFDPTSSVAVVACAPGKVDDIATGLTSEGFDVEKRTLDIDTDELDEEESESGSEESK